MLKLEEPIQGYQKVSGHVRADCNGTRPGEVG